MAINTIDNFSYKGAKPLDARLVFNTLDEMTSYPKENLYVGIIMYCRETSKHYTYNGISIDEMSIGSGTGGSIDESKFALKSDLDEFDTEAYKDGVNAFIDKAKKEVVTLGQLDEFDTNAYKDEVNAFINEAKKDVLTVDRFDTFDTRAYEAKVNTFIDEAKKDILTIDKFDTFDTRAFKSEVNVFINEAKKDILTIDKFDVFDTRAYKQELQTIANEVTNKMSIFNELTEIDIDELKAQIKAEILAELRTVASANGAGA